MGRQGGRGHLKREVSPKFWPINRKQFSWAIKPVAGPHPIQESIPLLIIVREMLGFAKTRNEAKKIISRGKILVDGKVRLDEHFPAGMMDVVSVPEIQKHYRVLPSKKGLILHPISEEEAKFKLCRIEDKKTLQNGHVQLNLHDGRNFLLPPEDSQSPSGDAYPTLGTLKIGIPEQEISERLKTENGMTALFLGGKNIGKFGKITSIEERPEQKRKNLLATIEDEEGQKFQTTLNYVFVIGDKKLRISLPTAEE